ncbi:MAG: hypothetical protein JKY41_13525 [Rhodobacteraceae bacterium]|nr:hypothetical protein [Paracoccaceae bacterium]
MEAIIVHNAFDGQKFTAQIDISIELRAGWKISMAKRKNEQGLRNKNDDLLLTARRNWGPKTPCPLSANSV